MKVNVKLAFLADLELTLPEAANLINLDYIFKIASDRIKDGLDAALRVALTQLAALGAAAKIVQSGVSIKKVDQ